MDALQCPEGGGDLEVHGPVSGIELLGVLEHLPDHLEITLIHWRLTGLAYHPPICPDHLLAPCWQHSSVRHRLPRYLRGLGLRPSGSISSQSNCFSRDTGNLTDNSRWSKPDGQKSTEDG